MSNTTYIERLKKSRTYQVGILTAEGYNYQSSFWGMLNTLPPPPQADAERHIIILNIRNDYPTILKVLSHPGETEPLTTRHVGKVALAYLSKKPKQFKLASPPEGYQLGDGEQISADIELFVQITNAKEFWEGSEDPIGALMATAINETRKYFLGLSNSHFISKPLYLPQGREQQVPAVTVNKIEDELEEMLRNIGTNGMSIRRVVAKVHLTEYLKSFVESRLSTYTQRRQPANKSVLSETLERVAVAKIKDHDLTEPFVVGNSYVLMVGILDEAIETDSFETVSLSEDQSEYKFDIMIYAEDMDVTPFWIQSYVYDRTNSSDLLEFVLIPEIAGNKLVRVDYLYHQHWLTKVKFEIEVLPQGSDTEGSLVLRT